MIERRSPNTIELPTKNAMVAATQSAGLYGKKAEQHCLSILNQTELLPKANILAGSLTLLELKRLELTRALCTRPKLLLLDEIAGQHLNLQ